MNPILAAILVLSTHAFSESATTHSTARLRRIIDVKSENRGAQCSLNGGDFKVKLFPEQHSCVFCRIERNSRQNSLAKLLSEVHQFKEGMLVTDRAHSRLDLGIEGPIPFVMNAIIVEIAAARNGLAPEIEPVSLDYLARIQSLAPILDSIVVAGDNRIFLETIAALKTSYKEGQNPGAEGAKRLLRSRINAAFPPMEEKTVAARYLVFLEELAKKLAEQSDYSPEQLEQISEFLVNKDPKTTEVSFIKLQMQVLGPARDKHIVENIVKHLCKRKTGDYELVLGYAHIPAIYLALRKRIEELGGRPSSIRYEPITHGKYEHGHATHVTFEEEYEVALKSQGLASKPIINLRRFHQAAQEIGALEDEKQKVFRTVPGRAKELDGRIAEIESKLEKDIQF